jgi:hypothetical protein
MHRVLLLACIIFAAPAQEKTQHTDAELKVMARIQQMGGLAMEIAQNDGRLDVSFQQVENFSDDSLRLLNDLKEVAHVNLRGLNVTDAGMANLRNLRSVTRLHLELTKVTDKGLESIKGLVNLEYLNLYGTAITDAGLVHLEGLKNLRNLYLWQTKVTDAGVARLKKALPQLDIVRGLELETPQQAAATKAEKKAAPKKVEAKKIEKKGADTKK